MKYSCLRRILVLLAILTPCIAWAAPTSVEVTDKSMQYLGSVFGKMGTLPLGVSDNVLFGQIMLFFNQVVLALATLIVVYTVVASTIHTAHEGEIMGKKWSSIFIPARIGAGLWLLVPASSGYSYIQIIIMWFLIQGVGIANSLWEQVLIAYDRGEGIRATVDTSDLAPTNPLGSNEIDRNAIKGVFKSQVCVQVVNRDPEALQQLTQGVPLTVFRSADGNRISWGVESSGQPICGSITLPERTLINNVYSSMPSSTDEQFTQFRNQVADLIQSGLSEELENPAQEAATVPSENWDDFASLITAQSNFKSGKQAILTRMETGGSLLKSQVAQTALADGWIHAGSYYTNLIAGTQSGPSSTINVQVTGPNFDLIGGGDLGQTLSQKINTLTEDYLTKASQDRLNFEDNATRSRETVGSSLPWPFNEIVAAISSPFWGVAEDVMNKMSGRTDNSDPMIAISKMGGLVVEVTEGVFLLAFLPIVIVGLLTSVARGCASVGHVFQTVVLAVLLPLFMLFLGFFYAAGILLALYIPLIPFLVFTFAAITWMILVIEAIVAAPLVALILVVPSEDELGKAGHSLVILLGLFLRPALMILGFIVAIKLLAIGVKLVNFGFSTVVYENKPAFSLFFPIAVVVLYAGLLTYIVHEAFSLIYVIPDKVLRWMGGTPEGEDIMGKVKKGESDVEKGAASAKSGIGSMASAGGSSLGLAGKKGK